MTISGARAGNQQKHQGSLEVGRTADFIVLDRNLFDVPVDKIGATKVIRTVFEGETVFHRQ
ncbi:amidohydrolase family protein [Paenarthrobacter nicotinovorans]|uniref:amidohydrolase family protein n=1 Tax=Paenarthrobacter TaxID=1742992 RepID=UPI003DA45D14